MRPAGNSAGGKDHMLGTFILVLALLVAALVLGSFVKGLRRDRKLTQPLASIAGLYGRFLILYLGLVVFLDHGFASGGLRGSVCVDTGHPYGGAAKGFAASPGASLSLAGDVRACALHPSIWQWGLFLLTKLPGLALWGCLLLLIWRLIREANSTGPFTPRAAAVIRQLGWVIIAGSMIAGALGHLGADMLTSMLMTPATFDAKGIVVDVLAAAPFKALVPVPALAGAALLTFARIIRVGAVMDDEIKATV
jgi:hypothetical protein